MKCPYCTSEIADEALACPHCTRDLYLFKPLLAKIDALEKRMGEMEGRLAASPAETTAAEPPAVGSAAEGLPPPLRMATEAAFAWGAPLALLLAAHVLIVVAYDLDTLYLRAVSLLIPLSFGFMLMSRRRHHFGTWSAAAFAMALCAVFGMSWTTSLVDHTPILPQDRHEWREFLEYAASIGFGYLAGMVLGRMFWRHRQAALDGERMRGLAAKLVKMAATGKESADSIQATVKKLQDVGSSLTAAGATAVSAYMGLKGFLGGG